ncbi:hypothetical protein BJY54_006970 [Streptomyces nodosus]|uniref:hypothetical protein n=1 Tax=Streptomyces nodosus TaxID=40318 RepID=UPI0014797727|nr:hypothetical protein [Streptomyces nodosus]MBB4796266.1 hypothetical protein [Streptomyces nodosus]
MACVTIGVIIRVDTSDLTARFASIDFVERRRILFPDMVNAFDQARGYSAGH